MKLLSNSVLIFFLLSCTGQTDKSATGDTNVIAAGKETLKRFTSKFEHISIDTFKVYSSDNLESGNYKFKGVKLDSAEVALLPNNLIERFKFDKDFYACFKFQIDSTYSGLIVRTPSEYMPSSIKLLILDNLEEKVIDSFIELAESIGDAGYSLEKKTWILDDNKFLLMQRDFEDKSVENEKDTTTTITEYLYLIEFNNQRFDTLNKDTSRLLKKYRKILEREASHQQH